MLNDDYGCDDAYDSETSERANEPVSESKYLSFKYVNYLPSFNVGVVSYQNAKEFVF